MRIRRSIACLGLVTSGCLPTYGEREPIGPRIPATCAKQLELHIVDEAGAAIAGAQVRVEARYWACGPSGLPEGCGMPEERGPIVVTDARGTAHVCDLDVLEHGRRLVPPSERKHRGRLTSWAVTVAYRDWPVAKVAPATATTVVLGPPRDAIVDVPLECTAAATRHLHVRALSDRATKEIWSTPTVGAMRGQRFVIAGLGPWHYWLVSTDDRYDQQKDPCVVGKVIDLDGHAPPPVAVIDHSDVRVDFAAFSGGRATLFPMGAAGDVMATGELDLHGNATLSFQPRQGGTYCLRLEAGDRCLTTFASEGGTARPDVWSANGREKEIEARCGPCATTLTPDGRP